MGLGCARQLPAGRSGFESVVVRSPPLAWSSPANWGTHGSRVCIFALPMSANKKLSRAPANKLSYGRHLILSLSAGVGHIHQHIGSLHSGKQEPHRDCTCSRRYAQCRCRGGVAMYCWRLRLCVARVGYPATAFIARWAPFVMAPCAAWCGCEV